MITPRLRSLPAAVALVLLGSAFGIAPARGTPVYREAGSPFDHGPFDGLLRRHVRDGHVDYPGFLRDRRELEDYLAGVATAAPWEWERAEQEAFWINVYNAWMVESVLDAWPVESVLDIGRIAGIIPTASVFRRKHRIAGAYRSLDDIEHRILRARFRDPRVHAALNCASRSCPALRSEAYRGKILDAQLDDAMGRFLHDPSRNRVFETPPRLSSIFKWYGEDFDKAAGSVWAYVRGRLDPGERERVAREVEPGYLHYDWSLNR